MSMPLDLEFVWNVQTSTDAYDFVEDGKFIYVLCGGFDPLTNLPIGYIEVYSWWGNEEDVSKELLPWDQQENLNKEPNETPSSKKLKLEKTITLEDNSFKWICLGYNCIFIFSNVKIRRYDIDPQNKLIASSNINWQTDIVFPNAKKHLCTPYLYNNKIWLLMENEKTATIEYENTGYEQKIFIYDVDTATLSIKPFSTTFQFTRGEFSSGFNDYIYVTNWSDFSVMKLDYNGDVISKLTVNANPYRITTDPYTRKITVISNAEMVTFIDPSTDVKTHSQGSAIGSISSLSFLDANNYWYTGVDKFGNVNIPTKHHRFSGGNEDYNYKITSDKYPNSEFHKLKIIKEFSYKVFYNNALTSVTVVPHVAMISKNYLYLIKLDTNATNPPKTNSISILGHTMLIGGPYNYQGEYL